MGKCGWGAESGTGSMRGKLYGRQLGLGRMGSHCTWKRKGKGGMKKVSGTGQYRQGYWAGTDTEERGAYKRRKHTHTHAHRAAGQTLRTTIVLVLDHQQPFHLSRSASICCIFTPIYLSSTTTEITKPVGDYLFSSFSKLYRARSMYYIYTFSHCCSRK